MSTGLEKYYLSVPRSIVGKAYLEYEITKWNTARDLQIQKQFKKFKVFIDDCYTNAWHATFAAYFDFNMKPVDFSTGDGYDWLADSLYNAGKIDKIPDYKYFINDYAKTIKYWNGDKFVNKPTMNKRYLEAVKQLHH
jgi:hypothetical protein